jgi:TolB-like protein/Flp pilus assembly protein TadD
VIAKRMSGEIPSARRVRPSVPEPVEQSVRKSLAPVPADRFSTAGDFARALASSSHTTSAPPAAVEPPPAQPPPGPPIPKVAPTAPAHARRRIPPVFAASALSFLVGVGVLFAWRSHSASSTTSGGPVRLAVLPFDNLGDSADAYFADGLTDAVRNKLAALNGIEVIASTSSGQYRHTTKTAQQIGQELGARYLLVGKVRWARVSPTQSRVEVSPELIDATSAADKWGAPFDAPITDVFQVQADIAGKVAQQLKVALTPAAQHTLAQQPTHSLDAYDAYLHGERIEQASAAPVTLRRAVSAYEEAIERDSTFALAWAGLAIAKSRIYNNGVPVPAVGDSAHAAAARALELAADLPEAHAAMGLYYQLVAKDVGEALAEDSVALARAPNNVAVLRRTAQTEESLGRWPAAVEHLRRAARLDPRAAIVAALLGRADTWLRRYPAAREELDHAFTLQLGDPSLVEDRATVALAEGDLVGARAIIHDALATVDSASLFGYLATYYDLGWVLDSAQERALLGLGPAAFGDDRATRSIVFAEQYALRGDHARARVYADTARAGFEAQLKAAPNDPQRHVFLGLALAYLGRKADAVREGERGVSLLPISKDANNGAYNQHQLVRIYMVVGEPEKALDEVEPLLKIPYYLSPGWLKIDPNFAPLRGNPRFERLVSGS